MANTFEMDDSTTPSIVTDNTFEMDDAFSLPVYSAEVVKLLRNLIGDTDTTDYTYTDAKLESAVYVATVYVNTDLCLSYTISLISETITPSPVEANDYNFINMVAMKAACILTMAEQKLAANCSITVTDGPSTVKINNMAKDLAQMAGKFCDDYETAKFQYLIKGGCGSTPTRRAVITPTYSDELPN